MLHMSLTFVHIQGQSSYGYSDHTLAVFEELDSFSVQGEIPEVFVIEEVDGVLIKVKGEGLEEGDVVGQDFFIREVQLEDNDGVDVVI